MRRWTLLLTVLLTVAILVTGCQSQPQPGGTPPEATAAQPGETTKLIVGTSADYAPFEFLDEKGNYDGFDVQLMRRIGEKMGVEIEFRNINFDGLIPSLQTGKIDAIIAAMSATADRKEQVDFTESYFVGADAVLVAEDSGITITKNEDLANYRIGVQSGTLQENWMKENLLNAQVSHYDKADQAILDLQSGRIDVVAMDYYAALAYIGKENGVSLALKTEFAPEHMAIAVQKGSDDLRNRLNEAIKQLQEEGVVEELINQYLVEQ